MFIPKKSKIFDKLVELSTLVKETALVFRDMAHDWSRLEKGYELLKGLESRADKHVHSISDDIESYFILPLDKEDISELTESLDDLIDNLEQIANRMVIYGISESNDTLKTFSNLILEAVEQIHKCMLLIKQRKMASAEYLNSYRRVQDIESKGDHLHRNVLQELLGKSSFKTNEKDSISIIKWKEIYQTLEETLDRCEDISVILSRLRIKYT
ncbi:MAG: DUF47 family protein [Thermodesulfobacteriota bacterium]|nr:DUF47 family protein [Thermodesulfobacteriota bacterium]